MKTSSRSLAALALAVAASQALAHDDPDATASIGRAGDPEKAARTIAVDMRDTMRFVPGRVSVRRGQTIRFVVRNRGKVKHEMVLGTPDQLRAHAELMRRFPQMEHADPNQVSVEPGGTGTLIWQFTKAGTIAFACLQPGHFEGGMAGHIAVR